MKERTIRKRKISRDCWDLDNSFLLWLKQRLPVYLKEAGKIVNLQYYTFEYKGETYTQEQMIKKLISLVNSALDMDNFDSEYYPTIDAIFDIWKMIFHYMWW